MIYKSEKQNYVFKELYKCRVLFNGLYLYDGRLYGYTENAKISNFDDMHNLRDIYVNRYVKDIGVNDNVDTIAIDVLIKLLEQEYGSMEIEFNNFKGNFSKNGSKKEISWNIDSCAADINEELFEQFCKILNSVSSNCGIKVIMSSCDIKRPLIKMNNNIQFHIRASGNIEDMRYENIKRISFSEFDDNLGSNRFYINLMKVVYKCLLNNCSVRIVPRNNPSFLYNMCEYIRNSKAKHEIYTPNTHPFGYDGYLTASSSMLNTICMNIDLTFRDFKSRLGFESLVCFSKTSKDVIVNVLNRFLNDVCKDGKVNSEKFTNLSGLRWLSFDEIISINTNQKKYERAILTGGVITNKNIDINHAYFNIINRRSYFKHFVKFYFIVIVIFFINCIIVYDFFKNKNIAKKDVDNIREPYLFELNLDEDINSDKFIFYIH